MLDLNIDFVSNFTITSPSFTAFGPVAIAACALPLGGFWSNINSTGNDGHSGLSRDLRQSLCCGLLGRGRNNRLQQSERRDFHKETLSKTHFNYEYQRVLHTPSEQSIKHFVFKWILDNIEPIGIIAVPAIMGVHNG
jgi:hypothetical protein